MLPPESQFGYLRLYDVEPDAASTNLKFTGSGPDSPLLTWSFFACHRGHEVVWQAFGGHGHPTRKHPLAFAGMYPLSRRPPQRRRAADSRYVRRANHVYLVESHLIYLHKRGKRIVTSRKRVPAARNRRL